MAQVILLQPAGGYWEAYRTAPTIPLNYFFLTAYLRDRYTVKIIDQRFGTSWKDELKSAIGNDTICIGVTSYTGPTIKRALEMCTEARRLSSSPIVWGGIHVTLTPFQSLRHPLVDYVIVSEGELAFRKLVDRFDSGRRDAGDIPGVLCKDAPEEPPVFHDFITMDDIPLLPYDTLDAKRYLPFFAGKKTLNFQASRGCPLKCSFCYNAIFNKSQWRPMSVERIMEHLEYSVQELGVNDVLFVDDNIFIDMDRTESLMEKLAASRMSWQCQGIDIITLAKMSDETLQLMYDSGCRRIAIGVESGSKRIRKLLRKPGDRDMIISNMHRLEKFNILAHTTFIVGFPTETRQEIQETCNLTIELSKANRNVRLPFVFKFIPSPGSELFNLAVSQGFTPPETLEGWNSLNVNDFNQSEWNFPLGAGVSEVFLDNLSFVSQFLDRKANEYHVPAPLRILSNFYRIAAWFRFKHSFYFFMIEKKIFKWLTGRSVKAKWGKTAAD